MFETKEDNMKQKGFNLNESAEPEIESPNAELSNGIEEANGLPIETEEGHGSWRSAVNLMIMGQSQTEVMAMATRVLAQSTPPSLACYKRNVPRGELRESDWFENSSLVKLIAGFGVDE